MTSLQKIGREFFLRRMYARLDKTELARHAGVSITIINRIEKGDDSVSVNSYARVAAQLDARLEVGLN